MTDADEVTALLGGLIAIPSINPAFRIVGDAPDLFGEQAKALHVRDWLERANLGADLVEVLPGRPNVTARIAGLSGRRRLMLECHLDTVQVSGMADPFRPVARNGRLHGRGAVDDGGCVVAMMLAMRALRRDPPDADILFLAAMDEEEGALGIKHFLTTGERADGGIAGEPTGLRIVSACKGCVRWRIEIIGRAAHSSAPESGLDAIAAAGRLLAYLRAALGPRLAARGHPLVGSPTLLCTMIEGGQGVNTVAERCLLTFDRRTLPGETGTDAWREVWLLAQDFAATEAAGFRILCHPPFIDCLSMAVPSDAAIVAAARAACGAEDLPDTCEGVAYGSDASTMTQSGIPTLVFGPGSINQAHAADEYVEIAQVVTAARMIEHMARAF